MCQNSFPHVAVHFTEDHDLDHRLLTLGLWGGKEASDNASCTGRKVIAAPTLSAEQVFAVVVLYRNQPVHASKRKEKEIVASWVCPMSSEGFIAMRFTDEECVKVSGPNPYSLAERDSDRVQAWQKAKDYRQAMPHVFAVQTFARDYFNSCPNHSALRVDLTLLRRDTMHSVRVMENESFLNDGHCDFKFMGTEVLYHLTGEELATFGPSKAGRAARNMLYSTGASFIWFQSWFTFSSKLPSRGSDDEPDWLDNSRHAYEESRLYRPSDTDRTVLSRMSHVDFNVKALYIDLKKHSVNEGNGVKFGNWDQRGFWCTPFRAAS